MSCYFSAYLGVSAQQRHLAQVVSFRDHADDLAVVVRHGQAADVMSCHALQGIDHHGVLVDLEVHLQVAALRWY